MHETRGRSYEHIWTPSLGVLNPKKLGDFKN